MQANILQVEVMQFDESEAGHSSLHPPLSPSTLVPFSETLPVALNLKLSWLCEAFELKSIEKKANKQKTNW